MAEPLSQDPIVAVIIPALNEEGKIGRVLDKIPRDGRFEAIVVDDGSTDGTGDDQHHPKERSGRLTDGTMNVRQDNELAAGLLLLVAG